MSGVLARRAKALQRLGIDGAVLAPLREGLGHGVYARGDRRRKPMAKLGPADVAALRADGALAPSGFADCYLLSGAGRMRLRRDAAETAPYLAQHTALVARAVMDPDGALRMARGVDPAGPIARLSRISDASGVAFFAGREIAAARQLWTLWARSQRGLMRGSDLEAPPLGSAPRGPGGVQENATLGAIDARTKVSASLNALPRPLAAAVTAFCLQETGIEALERRSRWPARSGKVVLKLALELLADHYEAA